MNSGIIVAEGDTQYIVFEDLATTVDGYPVATRTWYPILTPVPSTYVGDKVNRTYVAAPWYVYRHSQVQTIPTATRAAYVEAGYIVPAVRTKGVHFDRITRAWVTAKGNRATTKVHSWDRFEVTSDYVHIPTPAFIAEYDRKN